MTEGADHKVVSTCKGGHDGTTGGGPHGTTGGGPRGTTEGGLDRKGGLFAKIPTEEVVTNSVIFTERSRRCSL